MEKKTPAETPGTSFEWEPPILYQLTEPPKELLTPDKLTDDVQQG